MNAHNLLEEIESSLRQLPEEIRSEDLGAKLHTYLDQLLSTNRSINLVSRQETQKHVSRFTRECLYLASLLHADQKRLGVHERPPRLLDLGSGGGFPGLVLKLVLPDFEITLVESTQKKARFLAEVCRRMDLRRITVIWARAEDLANRKAPVFRPEFRHSFDGVTAKALGTLYHSTRLALPFLNVGGAHWTFKGPGVHDELKSCARLFKQTRLEQLHLKSIPGDEESFVVALRRLPPAKNA